MCGLAGVVCSHSSDFSEKNLQTMLNKIEHRGPDDYGIWTSNNILLGHRRLSIHDLSSAGHQPMHSHSGRFTIVFNGEIYNFEEIRAQLPHIEWRGTSDTEVMLHAIDILGVEKSLQIFNGMFAFALWDNVEQCLTLARDKFGEKPLYYGVINNHFVFASELTCIEAEFGEYLTINKSAIAKQAAVSYIPAPLSIYKEVKKLQAGSFVQYKGSKLNDVRTFWSLASVIEKAKKDQFSNDEEAVDHLHGCLKRAVKQRMASDVPLGAFLSGGVDSSLVVSLMQTQSDKPVNTFSIGFDVPGYNEAEFAKEVADYLGTNHHEKYFTPKDVLDVVPRLGAMFDEPFSDASQMPTYLVSAMAKEKVTVALSGDGGDELFSGYNRYTATPAIWDKISKVPARQFMASVIKKTPNSILNTLFFFLTKKASSYGRQGKIGPKLKALANWLGATSIEEFYRQSITHWKESDNLVFGSLEHNLLEFLSTDEVTIKEFGEWMMYLDSMTYLSGDILTKVDRTAMSVSLEGRIPLLDPSVVEAAWRMPFSMKQKGNIGKWPLKQVLYQYLPREMMERPKMGFGVPIHDWLRSELKEWTQDLLSFERLKNQGLYNPVLVQDTLTKHLETQENNAAKLWDILMVQAWFDADTSRLRRL
ncbi:asparagine synthase (glutamine-hydrolyzing) [Pseudoalteromonas sp. S3260]|uniref:asparagine synthase (glutamine-hydrolyzing) n=1 Tax=Pseudoalteromonas sp. S3260 TaxID=579534 RepID=UPI00110B8BBC|nr:asparagine synthase (glutamine-hydrolyzing) [Pseudoalteromonas sp. S3260]TMO99293.1 asparagine synthase (glutamine-hydrolyzing) [Pseudoalteromonas sp. S3260]